jgi:serine/threonine protein kinase
MQIRLTFTALLKAVAHLHSKRVVHGDLKPLNIMRVGVSYRIIDFDAAVDLSVSRYCGAKYTSGCVVLLVVGMAACRRPPSSRTLPVTSLILYVAGSCHPRWCV